VTDLDRVALYSALYGAYEYVKPLPPDLGCRAVLYTDEPGIEAPGWEVRVVTDHISSDMGADRTAWPDRKATWSMLAHKFWKCHPATAVPDADVTLWVDASLLITVDGYAKRCLEALGGDDWCAVTHPYRDCIYPEAAFSATLARYDAEALRDQVAAYRNLGHPGRWGLIATGANVRRHTPATVEMGEHWWWECVSRSHQDQLSLPVLFRLAATGALRGIGMSPFTWNRNMPWAQWWGVYEHGRPS
jgi:hypothetical protein